MRVNISQLITLHGKNSVKSSRPSNIRWINRGFLFVAAAAAAGSDDERARLFNFQKWNENKEKYIKSFKFSLRESKESQFDDDDHSKEL